MIGHFHNSKLHSLCGENGAHCDRVLSLTTEFQLVVGVKQSKR